MNIWRAQRINLAAAQRTTARAYADRLENIYTRACDRAPNARFVRLERAYLAACREERIATARFQEACR